jgi:hypothetical protein
MTLNLKNYLLSLAFAGIFAVLSHTAAGQGVSFRTNLAWDAVAEPNLGIEFPIGKHWSLGVNAGLKPWPRYLAWDWNTENPTHWRNFAVLPEARYYFKQVYGGLFLAGDAIYSHFNVGNVKLSDGNRYRLQGDLYGGILSVGYSWWIAPHWRIETVAGAGLGYAKADQFECTHCGSQVGTQQGVVLVPKLGINIAYNTKRRQQQKQEILQMIAPEAPRSEPKVKE